MLKSKHQAHTLSVNKQFSYNYTGSQHYRNCVDIYQDYIFKLMTGDFFTRTIRQHRCKSSCTYQNWIDIAGSNFNIPEPYSKSMQQFWYIPGLHLPAAGYIWYRKSVLCTLMLYWRTKILPFIFYINRENAIKYIHGYAGTEIVVGREGNMSEIQSLLMRSLTVFLQSEINVQQENMIETNFNAS